ncbi:MAG: hypothetical protein Q7T29_05985 [Gallionella sp.]|nr:hypothetical protein [Gallionella sp.]
MNQKLVLVDYENIQKADLSVLDDTYRAILFVGAKLVGCGDKGTASFAIDAVRELTTSYKVGSANDRKVLRIQQFPNICYMS